MIRDRYPGADVLAERGHWDDATRRVVLDRVHNVPPFRFFEGDRRRTLEALCIRVVPQAHRRPERRVPIAPWIDERCQNEATEGFRYDDLPPHPEAWQRGLAGLDEAAAALHGRAFADLAGDQQDMVLEAVRRGDPPGNTWRELPARRWWIGLALREIVGIYYAHPAAWDEIGYGGPAYPRGYAALNHGAREPWEAQEDDAARRQDERERLRDELRADGAPAPAGSPAAPASPAHVQALATTAADGTGPRPAGDMPGTAPADGERLPPASR